MSVDSVLIAAAGNDVGDGVALQLGRTPEPGCIDLGTLDADGRITWIRVTKADLVGGIQVISATTPSSERLRREARS